MTPWRSPIPGNNRVVVWTVDWMVASPSRRVTGSIGGRTRPTSTRWRANLTLSGHVGNDVHGVFIEVQGDGVEEFLARAARRRPPLSVIEDITVAGVEPQVESGFRIVGSAGFAVRRGDLRSRRTPRSARTV